MTAPAAAPASGPIVMPAPRPAPQAATDRFAFAAVLDSLPGAAAKAGSSVAGEGPRTSNEPRQGGQPPGGPDGYPMLGDGAFLSALPFALPPALATNAGRATPLDLPSPGLMGASVEINAATAAPANPAIAKLTGERAFLLAASTSNGSPPTAGQGQAPAAPFAPASPAPASPRGGGAPAAPSAALAPAAAQGPARGGWKSAAPPAPSAARVTSAPATPAKTQPSGQPADGPPPNPVAAAGQSAPQGAAFGASSPANFAAAPSFGPYDAPPAAAVDTTRASAPVAAPAPAGPPVREIDVDLSPSGLENVSMTMRLSGDKLSVVINAASSQTVGAIEGARDAIADRLAAIGQPLDSLIVKQTGVNPDANANGNAASADEGSTGGEQRSEQGAGGGSGANDPPQSRRGGPGGLRY